MRPRLAALMQHMTAQHLDLAHGLVNRGLNPRRSFGELREASTKPGLWKNDRPAFENGIAKCVPSRFGGSCPELVIRIRKEGAFLHGWCPLGGDAYRIRFAAALTRLAPIALPLKVIIAEPVELVRVCADVLARDVLSKNHRHDQALSCATGFRHGFFGGRAHTILYTQSDYARQQQNDKQPKGRNNAHASGSAHSFEQSL